MLVRAALGLLYGAIVGFVLPPVTLAACLTALAASQPQVGAPAYQGPFLILAAAALAAVPAVVFLGLFPAVLSLSKEKLRRRPLSDCFSGGAIGALTVLLWTAVQPDRLDFVGVRIVDTLIAILALSLCGALAGMTYWLCVGRPSTASEGETK